MTVDIDYVEATDDGDGRWTVTPHWKGVDRPVVHGWTGMQPSVADRLIQALVDGAVYSNVKVARDNYGKTYVQADSAVYGKRANADLRRLGY